MRNLAEFIQCPLEAVEGYDVAALNLRCAQGLPGAEGLDEGRMLGWLDQAAQRVQFETRRHWYRFNGAPSTYNNSTAYFCCYFLLQVLQEDVGIRYNPARVRDRKFQDPKCFDPDFSDSRDLFIHGMIDGPGGTCASMPVMYVAVGRRLGYPLKLVQTRGHLFARWDDPDGKCFGFPEAFNVEGSGEGIASYDDEHYKTWPEPWNAIDEAEGWYLKSMTPLEELASFLATRGDCLTDNGRLGEAAEAYAWASAIAPEDKRYQQILARTQLRCLAQHEQEIALLMETNRRNRERQQRALAGPMAGRPPYSGIAPAQPVTAPDWPRKSTFHEAVTRYNRELTEWNRLNQMGRARGMPPSAPRPGVDFDH
jgi:tetratricopeptide (TPR) repeat protein